MSFNSNGQIQYLVLNSLSQGSKYGLEIIEFISTKTDGNYIMKKPTLYSCLTRMEKKGLVSSSYWGESEFGGKRHYYTITNQGKRELELLSKEFEDTDFSADSEEMPIEENSSETTTQETEQTKPIFLQQDNIFDIVKNQETPSQDSISTQKPVENEDENDALQNQIDFFSYQEQQESEPIAVDDAVFLENNVQEDTPETQDEQEQSPETMEKIQYYQSILEANPTENKPFDDADESVEEEPTDDGKFLEDEPTLTPYQEEQNKRLYDTSTELKKYRNRKSFSENQIEMSVVYENAEDREIQKARIEQLKQSMLDARNNAYKSDTQTISTPTYEEQQDTFTSATNQAEDNLFDVNDESLEEEPTDDGKFITEPRISADQIPIQKRITPPNIEVNIYDDNLPAPKRDSNLEPTYKDMMAKLFERKKEKVKDQPTIIVQTENASTVDNFADYNSLTKYYRGHGIEFKEYKKTVVGRKHNTNFLDLLTSTLLFLLSGVGCGLLYWILSATGLIKANSVFLYYTIPALFFLYGIYKLVIYKLYPSKKASLKYNSVINLAVFAISALIVVVINILCGMQAETISQYLTSLLVPVYALLLAFPINYFIKKFTYKKFAK